MRRDRRAGSKYRAGPGLGAEGMGAEVRGDDQVQGRGGVSQAGSVEVRTGAALCGVPVGAVVREQERGLCDGKLPVN